MLKGEVLPNWQYSSFLPTWPIPLALCRNMYIYLLDRFTFSSYQCNVMTGTSSSFRRNKLYQLCASTLWVPIKHWKQGHEEETDLAQRVYSITNQSGEELGQIQNCLALTVYENILVWNTIFFPFNFSIPTFVIFVISLRIIHTLYQDYKNLMIISLLITSWHPTSMHPGHHFCYTHPSKNSFSSSTSGQVKPLPWFSCWKSNSNHYLIWRKEEAESEHNRVCLVTEICLMLTIINTWLRTIKHLPRMSVSDCLLLP